MRKWDERMNTMFFAVSNISILDLEGIKNRICVGTFGFCFCCCWQDMDPRFDSLQSLLASRICQPAVIYHDTWNWYLCSLLMTWQNDRGLMLNNVGRTLGTRVIHEIAFSLYIIWTFAVISAKIGGLVNTVPYMGIDQSLRQHWKSRTAPSETKQTGRSPLLLWTGDL